MNKLLASHAYGVYDAHETHDVITICYGFHALAPLAIAFMFGTKTQLFRRLPAILQEK